MQVHKQLKKKIEDNKLISHLDLLRSCNEHGFTDLLFTKLDLKLKPESKYLIAININNKPIILSHPNFYDFRQEIQEKMIKKPYYEGYDSHRNRVLLHYLGDGRFRVGNKKGNDEFITTFDECNFNLLTKRHSNEAFVNFLNSDEKHRGLQLLIAELGRSLGYKVKIARNDKKSILNCDYIEPGIEYDFISINDIELSNIIGGKAKSDIDLIDVIWYDDSDKRIIAAFEVERSRNYDSVLRRFSNLKDLLYSPYLICVGDDYFGFKNSVSTTIFSNYFKTTNLKYLPLENLYKILNDNNRYNTISDIPLLSTSILLNRNLLDVL